MGESLFYHPGKRDAVEKQCLCRFLADTGLDAANGGIDALSGGIDVRNFASPALFEGPCLQVSGGAHQGDLAALQFERNVLQGDEAFAGLGLGVIQIV